MPRKDFIMFAALMALVLTSCVYIPIAHTVGEKSVDANNLDWIRAGETTKEDVLHALGCPAENGPAYFLYNWKIHRGYWIFAIGGGYSGAAAGGSTASYGQLRILFDQSDKVTEFKVDSRFKVEPKWSTR
jgi:outer membrane protein assembly factor BamE (lipoprotein component of BamABCDE complex)